MAYRMGILGQKLGMTQVFAENGDRVPVTVIKVGPCGVVAKRTVEKDGYSAVVVGMGEKAERLCTKAELHKFKASGRKAPLYVKEFRLEPAEVEKFELGSDIPTSSVFEDGDVVDVSATSKGKGFQGVMKRHNMAGTKASHGVHESFRHGGSIGCRLTPGRVAKGKKMAGQMGNEVVTQQNLQLVSIDDEKQVVLVRGAVPGGKGSLVELKKAATRTEYKQRGLGQKESRSKNPLKASKAAAAGR